MRSKMIRFFTKWDLFPANFQPPLQNNEIDSYQHFSGGIISSVVYILGFMYLMFLLFEYSVGLRLPSVSISSLIYENQTNEFILPFQSYKLNMISFLPREEIEKLQNKTFFTQKNFLYINDSFIPPAINKSTICNYESNQKSDKQIFDSTACIDMDYQKTLKENSRDESQDTQFFSYLHHCEPNDHIQNCLSQVDEINLQAYWQIKTFYQILNYQTGQSSTVRKEYLIVYQPESTLEIQMVVKKALVQVDTGILFSSINQYEIITSIDIDYQNVDRQIWDNRTILVEIFVELDQVQEIINITYARLTDVLAGFQTLFSFLVLTGILIQELNSRVLQANLLNNLSHIFFPALRNFTFEQNWINKNVKVYDHNGRISLIQKHLINFRERIDETLIQKTGYVNMVRSINRLEIALSMILGKDFLQKLDQIGYQIPLDPTDQIQNCEQLIDTRMEGMLTEEDFYSISKYKNTQSTDTPLKYQQRDQMVLQQFQNSLEFKISFLRDKQNYYIKNCNGFNLNERKVFPKLQSCNTSLVNFESQLDNK